MSVFKDVINICGLPVCALRIRTSDNHGIGSFPGCIVKHKPDGTKAEPDREWLVETREISGKFNFVVYFYLSI